MIFLKYNNAKLWLSMRTLSLVLYVVLCGMNAYSQNSQSKKINQDSELNKPKPNVIFIKTDDQRFDSLSMTGHTVTKTPHIDKLAKDGVFFNNAFITSPICGPSRANFFTSQWERKNRQGFASVSHNHISHEIFDNSWQMRMKSAGYATAYIGKHHAQIGDKKEGGSYMKKNIDFCYLHKGHLGFEISKNKEFTNLKNTTQIEGLAEATDIFLNSPKGDESQENNYFFEDAHASVKDFINRRDGGKPFSISLNFNLPHASSIGGMGSQEHHADIYKTLYNEQQDKFEFPEGYPNKISLPDNIYNKNDIVNYYKVDNKARLLSKKTKMARAVTSIDNFVGKLRQQLETMGVADNTIIVFASDHGLLLGEHGLGGKTFLYEESIRIPMIIYSPYLTKTQQNKKIDQLVVGQDIPATILDMCGLEIPQTYQGKSTLPLIEGKSIDWRKEIFCENLFTQQGYPRMEAVRGEKWKYIRYFSKENDRDQYLPDASINGEKPIYEELFNLQNDPKEHENLAENIEYQTVLKNYRERCQKLVKELAQ